MLQGQFDCNSSLWKPHVQHLAKNTTKNVGQLWRHGRCLSLRARRLWYQSMIQSQLCYASSCFYPALTKELRKQVIRMSKAGIRSIFRVNQRTPTAPLLNRLSLPSLHQVFLQRLLIVISRSLHGMTSTLLEPLFTVLAPGEGTITRGQTNLLLQVRIPYLVAVAAVFVLLVACCGIVSLLQSKYSLLLPLNLLFLISIL